MHRSTRMQPRTPRSSPWPPGPGDSGTRGATRSGGAGIRGVEQAAEGDERVVAEAGEGDVAVTVALVGRGRVDDQPAHGDLHLPDGERELDDVAAVEALRGAQAEATGGEVDDVHVGVDAAPAQPEAVHREADRDAAELTPVVGFCPVSVEDPSTLAHRQPSLQRSPPLSQ